MVLALIDRRCYQLAVRLLFGGDPLFRGKGRDEAAGLIMAELEHGHVDVLRRMASNHSWHDRAPERGSKVVGLRIYSGEWVWFEYCEAQADLASLQKITWRTKYFIRRAPVFS
jgi:hypothetical protein